MSDTVCCPKCRTLVRDDRAECELCGGELQPAAVPIGPDGRCLCSCGDQCPLGKTGLEYRCSEQKLRDAGVKTERVVVCATCRVRPAANGSLCEVCLGREDDQRDAIAHPPHYASQFQSALACQTKEDAAAWLKVLKQTAVG